MFTVYKYGHSLGCYGSASIFKALEWAQENITGCWVIEDENGFISARSNASFPR